MSGFQPDNPDAGPEAFHAGGAFRGRPTRLPPWVAQFPDSHVEPAFEHSPHPILPASPHTRSGFLPDATPVLDQPLAEDASYRWGYMMLAYGLLAIVGYRGFILQETSWELLALVVGGGIVTSLHRAIKGESTVWWRLTAGMTAVVALALASWLAGRAG